MSVHEEPTPIVLPEGLPPGWTSRVPHLEDLETLVRLRGADRQAWTGSASVDRAARTIRIPLPAKRRASEADKPAPAPTISASLWVGMSAMQPL